MTKFELKKKSPRKNSREIRRDKWKMTILIFRMAKVRFRLTNVHYVWILSIIVSFFYGLIDKAGFL